MLENVSKSFIVSPPVLILTLFATKGKRNVDPMFSFAQFDAWFGTKLCYM